jgi:hypothetical protein
MFFLKGGNQKIACRENGTFLRQGVFCHRAIGPMLKN